jgi:hypothetical protein
MPEVEVNRLRDTWKAAYDELYEAVQLAVGNAETFDAQQVWGVHYTWETKQQAYEDAQRAYYRELRDRYGFQPPAGVRVDPSP